jgi:Rad3-related DNA helicase
LKDPETTKWLRETTNKVVTFHEGQKGLIIAPSFFLGSQVVKGLGCKVFEHIQGRNLSQLIKDFKMFKGSAVLVSPSIFEGLDFKNDESRFQIIVKSPFASLADKRIKYIADNYPTIYQEMTLLKILQGIGRSVRTPEDFAATYFLDASSKKLYDSKLNLWKDHYVVKT